MNSWPVRAYRQALHDRPIRTKCGSSGTLMAVADVLRQRLEHTEAAGSGDAPSFAWDVARTCRLTSFAVLIHAPFVHCYHPVIERLFAPVAHISGITIAKVVFDQTIVAPPFMAGFLSYMTLAEGRTLADVQTRVTQQLRPLILDSWTVWMPAHCITFNLPVPVRLLWQDCVRLYFGTVMSMRSNRRLISES